MPLCSPAKAFKPKPKSEPEVVETNKKDTVKLKVVFLEKQVKLQQELQKVQPL